MTSRGMWRLTRSAVWAQGEAVSWSRCTICTYPCTNTHLNTFIIIVSKHWQSVTSLRHDSLDTLSHPARSLPRPGCRHPGGGGGGCQAPFFKLHIRYYNFLLYNEIFNLRILLLSWAGLLKLTTVNSTTYNLISLIVGGSALAVVFVYLLTASPTFQSQYRSFSDGESSIPTEPECQN